MTIRSNPPGALVYIDDYEIGTTPVTQSYLYYGTRKIRLVKDGYETLTVMQSVPAPWYEIPPLDFVSENVVPSEIRDQREFCYQLTPQRIVPTEELLGRAEGLRRGVPAPASLAPLAPTAPLYPGSAVPLSPVPRTGVAEPLPTPQGIGGQSVYPLPSGGGGR